MRNYALYLSRFLFADNSTAAPVLEVREVPKCPRASFEPDKGSVPVGYREQSKRLSDADRRHNRMTGGLL